MPAASLVQTVAQDVPFNQPTELTFDTVDYDTSAGQAWTQNAGVITVNAPGVYDVHASVNFPEGLPSGVNAIEVEVLAGGQASRSASAQVAGVDARAGASVSTRVNVLTAPREFGASVTIDAGPNGSAQTDVTTNFRAQLQVALIQ